MSHIPLPWLIMLSNSDDPLTSVMILLAHVITRNFSYLTNNRLHTSSNTRNQAIVQGDKVNIQSNSFGNDGRNTRRSYVHEEVIASNNVQNDAGNIQRTHRTTSSGTVANDEAGDILTDEQNDFLFADASRMEEIEELSTNSNYKLCESAIKDYQEQKYPTQPKIINKSIGDDQIDSNIIFDEPNEDVNSGSVENDNNVQDSYELKRLARNAYKEAEKQ
ncbi:hypothetical protein Tco_1100028 [Tanacetum coccineum]